MGDDEDHASLPLAGLDELDGAVDGPAREGGGALAGGQAGVRETAGGWRLEISIVKQACSASIPNLKHSITWSDSNGRTFLLREYVHR